MRIGSAAVLAALTLSGPLAAQQQPPPPDSARHRMMHEQMMAGEHQAGMMRHMMPGQAMSGPMDRAMGYAPDHLLGRREALALTEQQVMRLTALRESAKAAREAAAAEAETRHKALAQAMAANAPDTAALRTQFLAAHAAAGNAHWAMLRSAAQAKALLTDAQRGRVEGWMDAGQMRMSPMGPQPMGRGRMGPRGRGPGGHHN